MRSTNCASIWPMPVLRSTKIVPSLFVKYKNHVRSRVVFYCTITFIDWYYQWKENYTINWRIYYFGKLLMMFSQENDLADKHFRIGYLNSCFRDLLRNLTNFHYNHKIVYKLWYVFVLCKFFILLLLSHSICFKN